LEASRQILRYGIYNVGAPDSNHRINDAAEAAEELTWARTIRGDAPAPSSYQVDFSRIAGLRFKPERTLYCGCREILAHAKEIPAEKEMPVLVPQFSGMNP
jgi:hypothetical protein